MPKTETRAGVCSDTSAKLPDSGLRDALTSAAGPLGLVYTDRPHSEPWRDGDVRRGLQFAAQEGNHQLILLSFKLGWKGERP